MLSKPPIVLVTGSTSGIGLEISRKFAKEGCTVIQNARNIPDKSRIIGDDFFVADVTNIHDCEILAQEVLNKYEKIDILISNVGSGTPKRNSSSSTDKWNHFLSINLFSAINVIESFLPRMHSSKILAISSICGSALVNDAPIEYSVSKAALNHYMRLLALRYANSGHMFNVISPGNVLFEDSRWSEKLVDDKVGTLNYIKNNVPMGNFIGPEEIADLAYFLTSSANKSITGTVIRVDGGQGL